MLRRAWRKYSPSELHRSTSASIAVSGGRVTLICRAARLIAPFKAGRPTGGEQLLGVCAIARSAGNRQSNVQPAIVAARGACPATRRMGLSRIHAFRSMVIVDSFTCCSALERMYLSARGAYSGHSSWQLRLRHRQWIEAFAEQLDLARVRNQVAGEQLVEQSTGRSGGHVRHILGERLVRCFDENRGIVRREGNVRIEVA